MEDFRKSHHIDKGSTIYSICLGFLILNSHVDGAVVNSVHRNGIFVVYASGIGQPEKGYRNYTNRPSYEEYERERGLFLQEEESRAFGSKIQLNDREELANDVFRIVKKLEMENGFSNPKLFPPARHIFRVLNEIEKSDLFYLLRRMPKGGVLHAHDTALASTDYVISLTYWSYLWQRYDSSNERIAFKFSKEKPDEEDDGGEWCLVSRERSRMGKKAYDSMIRRHFTLYTDNPETDYEDINHVWECFKEIFETITPLLTYVPAWKAYYKHSLREFYDDGVQYLEFRGTLPDLYDLDGRIYKNGEIIKVYVEALKEFKEEQAGFIGSKFIYAPPRSVDDITFDEYMTTVKELKSQFPDFVVGFDIVSQEDTGRPLIDFAEKLLKLPDNINFYFHAGETNWNGMSTDENLIDAVLLGTKRIGHGYAILKHPKVLDAVKKNSIAIELNPISNQVLKLLDDNRNHPGAYLFADDYPLVVSSDDPSFWEATPLTHDLYIAFLGIASAHADLRTLKQLAINSLVYSSLDSGEREIALRKWQMKWNLYIEWVITQRYKYNL